VAIYMYYVCTYAAITTQNAQLVRVLPASRLYMYGRCRIKWDKRENAESTSLNCYPTGLRN